MSSHSTETADISPTASNNATANDDDSSSDGGLRRSKRRNKFHLDVPAMLCGNNPDRRLSPPVEPRSRHESGNLNISSSLSTSGNNDASVQYRKPRTPSKSPNRSKSPNVAKASGSKKSADTSVESQKSTQRLIGVDAIEAVEKTASGKEVEATGSKKAYSATEVGEVGAEEVVNGDEADQEANIIVIVDDDDPFVPGGKPSGGQPSTVPHVSSRLSGLVGGAAGRAVQPPATVSVFNDHSYLPPPKPPSFTVRSVTSTPRPQVNLLKPYSSPFTPHQYRSGTGAAPKANSTSVSTPLFEKNQAPPTSSSGRSTAATASGGGSDLELGKRKRKVPLRHRDFSSVDELEDDDEDLEDEAIFKSAKIEYTNVDGTKSSDDFSCPKCPSQFESRVGLTNHLKLHGAGKQLPCDMCDFSCTNKKTMRQHRRIHGVVKKPPVGKRSRAKAAVAAAAKNVEEKPQIIVSPPRTLTISTPNVEQSPSALAEMQPRMRAIDAALRLNLDEDGNPKLPPSPPQLASISPAKQEELNSTANDTGEFELKIEDTSSSSSKRGKTSSGSFSNTGQKSPNKSSRATSNYKVKCPHCPFGTRNSQRLRPHIHCHERKSGYVCQFCTFKTDSVGFLKRHVVLHGVSEDDCKWPPNYVGTTEDQKADLRAWEQIRSQKQQNQGSVSDKPQLTESGVDESSSEDQQQTAQSSADPEPKRSGIRAAALSKSRKKPPAAAQQQQQPKNVNGGAKKTATLLDAAAFSHPEVADNSKRSAIVPTQAAEANRAMTLSRTAQLSATATKNRFAASHVGNRSQPPQKVIIALSALKMSQQKQRVAAVGGGAAALLLQRNLTKAEASSSGSKSAEPLRRSTRVVKPTSRSFYTPPDYSPDHNNDDTDAAENLTDSTVLQRGEFKQLKDETIVPTVKCELCDVEVEKRFHASLVSHYLKDHIMQIYPQLLKPELFAPKVAKIKSHMAKKGNKTTSFYTPRVCTQCGVFIRFYGAYRLHYILYHRSQNRIDRRVVEEMLKERIAQEKSIKETDAKTFAPASQPTTPAVQNRPDSVASSISSSQNSAERTFKCAHCPFSCSQVVKLDTHERKHFVKSEHQCAHCTFSCRSSEFLQQHMRLHTVRTEEVNESEELNAQALPTPKSSGRRNELHRCNECPYMSKHGCDMKAHKKMHQPPKRLYGCDVCSYSAMRMNALKTHHLLHEGIQPQHIREEELRKQNMAASGSAGANSSKDGFQQKKDRCLRVIRDRYGRVLGRKWERTTTTLTDSTSSVSIIYKCRICLCEMAYCSDLFRHSRHHFVPDSVYTKFACSKCGFKTNVKSIVEEHMAAHRQIDGPEFDAAKGVDFKCAKCPFVGNTYAKMWHHFQKHRISSRFPCTKCTFSVGSAHCLRHHLALHNADAKNDCKKSSSPCQRDMEVLLPHQSYGYANEFDADDDYKEERFIIETTDGSRVEEEYDRCGNGGGGDTPPPRLEPIRPDPAEEEEPLLPNAAKSASVKSSGSNSSTMTTRRASKRATAVSGCVAEKSADIDYEKLIVEMVNEEPTLTEQLDAALAVRCGGDERKSSAAENGAASSSRSAPRLQCAHCPFECSDRVLHEMHAEMHVDAERPFKCNMCSYNSFSAESLHAHLSLHAPPLSPGSAAAMRRQRRQPSLYVADVLGGGSASSDASLAGGTMETVAANAVAVLQCSQCSFRTVHNDRYMRHRMEHVQLLQQRLTTTIKRAAAALNQNGASSSASTGGAGGVGAVVDGIDSEAAVVARLRLKRAPRRTDRQHMCPKCSFRCDTVVAFARHMEFHGNRSAAARFRCAFCDYAAETHNILLFHEHNHHFDASISALCRRVEILRRRRNGGADGSGEEDGGSGGGSECGGGTTSSGSSGCLRVTRRSGKQTSSSSCQAADTNNKSKGVRGGSSQKQHQQGESVATLPSGGHNANRNGSGKRTREKQTIDDGEKMYPEAKRNCPDSSGSRDSLNAVEKSSLSLSPAPLVAGTYRCVRCADRRVFYEWRDLDRHWEETHVNVANATERDREIGEMLKMNMVPRSAVSVV